MNSFCLVSFNVHTHLANIYINIYFSVGFSDVSTKNGTCDVLFSFVLWQEHTEKRPISMNIDFFVHISFYINIHDDRSFKCAPNQNLSYQQKQQRQRSIDTNSPQHIVIYSLEFESR